MVSQPAHTKFPTREPTQLDSLAHASEFFLLAVLAIGPPSVQKRSNRGRAKAWCGVPDDREPGFTGHCATQPLLGLSWEGLKQVASARARALLSTWHALQCGAMHMSLHRRCLPEQDSFRGSQMDADLFLGFKDELGNRVELQAPTPPGSIEYDCFERRPSGLGVGCGFVRHRASMAGSGTRRVEWLHWSWG